MAVSETWRDVPGYGGKYQASDMGHIANTFWHGQKRKNGGRTILTQYKRKPRGKAKLQSAKRYVHLTDLEGDNGLDLVASVGQQFIAWADSKPKDIGGACSHSIAIAKGLGRIRWQGVPTAADWMEAARQTRRDGGQC